MMARTCNPGHGRIERKLATLREGRWLDLQSETLFQAQSLARVLRIRLVLFTAVLWSNHPVKVEIHRVWIFQLKFVYVCIDLYVICLFVFEARSHCSTSHNTRDSLRAMTAQIQGTCVLP